MRQDVLSSCVRDVSVCDKHTADDGSQQSYMKIRREYKATGFDGVCREECGIIKEFKIDRSMYTVGRVMHIGCDNDRYFGGSIPDGHTRIVKRIDRCFCIHANELVIMFLGHIFLAVWAMCVAEFSLVVYWIVRCPCI